MRLPAHRSYGLLAGAASLALVVGACGAPGTAEGPPADARAVAPSAAAISPSLASSTTKRAPSWSRLPTNGRVPAASVGIHPSGGVLPTVTVGSLRLWDTGTSWRKVETRRGVYDFSKLDRLVAAARADGIRDITYVFGSTPAWAARDSKPGLFGPGVASPPRHLSDFTDFAAALATRYKGRITAYEMWNEADLTASFWNGGPALMARMTARAYRAIKARDRGAIVVSASTTTRILSSYNAFFPTYLKKLRKRGWPVDAFAVHSYPLRNGGPVQRQAQLRMVRADLARAGAPVRPLWDTEVNYGLQGDATLHIGGRKAASYVARTFLDSIRFGVAKTYWYTWQPYASYLGITVYQGQPGAVALERVGQWTAGSRWRGCTSRRTVVSCTFGTGGAATSVQWTEHGKADVEVPAGVSAACPAVGACTTVKPGRTYRLTRLPVRFA